MPLATEALTLMVVVINDSFTLPVGYFFIDGLGQERANLVRQCLTRLDSVRVTAASLTLDGCAPNLNMAKQLGCNYNVDGLKSWFLHPVTKEKVVTFLDPYDMLKLVQNTIGDKKSIVDGDKKFVKWEYFEELHKLQESEGLHLANKLRSAHILWFKKKMNVNLAAQLLSESVATALELCL